jgi:hypothetical protein
VSLQIEGFTLKIKGKIIFKDIKFSSRKVLQIKELSQRLLSLLHLHFSSTLEVYKEQGSVESSLNAP